MENDRDRDTAHTHATVRLPDCKNRMIKTYDGGGDGGKDEGGVE